MKNQTDIISDDLSEIRNPSHRKHFKLNKSVLSHINNISGKLFPKNIFYELVTGRNRNLITPDEQKYLQNSTVAFFGLSVGSHAVCSWMMLSRAEKIIICDPDIVAPTNLNRIYASWSDIGKLKTYVCKNRLKNINPYCQIYDYNDKNPTSDRLGKIIGGPPHVNIIIDEIDDIIGKIRLREIAKTKKTPLISAADVGNNVIIDIERYDLQPNTKPFLGRLTESDINKIPQMTAAERKKMIIKLVGFDANSLRLLKSVREIGKSVPTWPQLGSTATIAGGIIANLIMNIRLGENIISGRYVIDLDRIFINTEPDYDILRKDIIKDLTSA